MCRFPLCSVSISILFESRSTCSFFFKIKRVSSDYMSMD